MINKTLIKLSINDKYILHEDYQICIFPSSALCPKRNPMKYSYVGKVKLNPALQIQAAGTTNWTQQPRQIQISFPQSLRNQNVFSFITLSQFESKGLTNGISIYLQYSQNKTTATAFVYTNNASNIQKCSLNYIIYERIDGTFGLIFYYLDKHFNPQKLISNTYYWETIFQMSLPKTLISGMKFIPMMTGIAASTFNQTNIFDVFILVDLISLDRIQIKLFSYSSYFTKIGHISFQILMFNPNQAQIQSKMALEINGGIITGKDTKLANYKFSQYQTVGINTLVGLSAFSIFNQSIFSFFQSVTPQHGIVITSNNAYDHFAFTFIVIQSNYCHYTTPYYQSLTQLCYDVCPDRSLANNYSLACECSQNLSLSNNFTNGGCVSMNFESAQSGKIPLLSILELGIGLSLGITFLIVIIIISKKCKEKKGNQIKKVAKKKKYVQFSKRGNQNKKQQDENNQNPQRKSKSNNIQKQPLEWFQGTQEHSTEQKCGLCLKSRAFLKTQCSHTFHLSCLAEYIKTNKGCQVCGQIIQLKARFFCNSCHLRYKIVQLDNIQRNYKFLTICQKCNQIQYELSHDQIIIFIEAISKYLHHAI